MRARQPVSVCLVALALAFVSGHVRGQEPAGTVIFVAGAVSVQRTQIQPLAKGDAVEVGDVIITGATGRAQVVMADGAKLAIRPDSRFRIDDFTHEPAAAPRAPVVTGAMDRSFMSLLKGGFRTITGLIGQADEEAYEVRTPVGTLGIRGTDYTAVFCLSDCVWAPGLTSAQPPEDGLYIGVTLGVVVFRNELTEIEVGAGGYAFIPIIDRLPQLLDAPPPVLLEQFDLSVDVDPAGPPQADADGPLGFDAFSVRRTPASTQAALMPGGLPDDSSQQGSAVPAQPVLATDMDGLPVDLTAGIVPLPDPRSISFSVGPLGMPPGFPFSGTRENAPNEYVLDGSNNLMGFVGPYPARTGPVDGTFALGTSTQAETGFDSVTLMRWGRWAGGIAALTLPGGIDASQDLSNQSLHWVSGPEFSSPPSIPVTGTANYTLVGGTSPTDNFGNVGVVANATFAADFTNLSVSSTLDLGIGASSWTATGTGIMGPLFDPAGPLQDFQGFYNTVTIDGVGGGAGVFSGFFSEPGAGSPSLPGGAGLTYSLQDVNGGVQVSGALVFGNPN